GQAVRDQDGRALAEEAAQLVEDRALGLGVDARERVVEDEHPRRCGEHARERDALLLPARERDAALADDRLEALGKLRQVARERPTIATVRPAGTVRSTSSSTGVRSGRPG